MKRFQPVLCGGLLWAVALLSLAACGPNVDGPDSGEISAKIVCPACAAADSVYLAARSDGSSTLYWGTGCGCCPPDTCYISREASYGEYELEVLMRDSARKASGGTDGNLTSVGFYTAEGLTDNPDEAARVTLSEENPEAELEITVLPME